MYIDTCKGKYFYEEQHLFHGRKAINIDVSIKNLIDFKKVADSSELNFGLIYGTLLGIYRDGSLIPWDEDVDVYMLKEDQYLFHDVLWDLKELGFDLVRVDGDLYSIMRENDYIDIYFFEKKSKHFKCNSDVIKEGMFDFSGFVCFQGEKFRCPEDIPAFLAAMYGDEWMTPKKNEPARPWSKSRIVKNYFKGVLESLGLLDFSKKILKKLS